MVLYPYNTQVMFMVPLKSNDTYDAFVKRNNWSVVCTVPKGVALFDKPSKVSPFIE